MPGFGLSVSVITLLDNRTPYCVKFVEVAVEVALLIF